MSAPKKPPPPYNMFNLGPLHLQWLRGHWPALKTFDISGERRPYGWTKRVGRISLISPGWYRHWWAHRNDEGDQQQEQHHEPRP